MRLTEEVGVREDFAGVKDWKVSASQVKTWTECPRKWGFRYLDGIITPPTAAAALGTAVHKELENYLNHGTLPDPTTRAGKIATRGLEFMPNRLDVFGVEEEVLFRRDGVLFRGFVDALAVRGEEVMVMDHKTSSDPQRWGLNPKSIMVDVQALIYATHGLDFFGVDHLTLRWVYFRTRGGAQTYPVDAHITRDHIHEHFDLRVGDPARAILRARGEHIRNGIKAKDLEPNPRACGNFGGCPHAAYCPRSRGDILTSVLGNQHQNEKETNTMSLKDLINKKAAAAAPSKPNKKLPPPRADKTGAPSLKERMAAIKAAKAADNINSPEAPATVEVARELSRVVEGLDGNPKQRKARAKAATDAAFGETSPEAAKDKAKAAVESAVEAEPPKLSKSQAEVMNFLEANGGECLFAKSRAMETDAEPFAHGRTLNALVGMDLITVEEEATARRVRKVGATPKEEAAPEEEAAPKEEVMVPASKMDHIITDAEEFAALLTEAPNASLIIVKDPAHASASQPYVAPNILSLMEEAKVISVAGSRASAKMRVSAAADFSTIRDACLKAVADKVETVSKKLGTIADELDAEVTEAEVNAVVDAVLSRLTASGELDRMVSAAITRVFERVSILTADLIAGEEAGQ